MKNKKWKTKNENQEIDRVREGGLGHFFQSLSAF
jgi:hypothetical protein